MKSRNNEKYQLMRSEKLAVKKTQDKEAFTNYVYKKRGVGGQKIDFL